VPKSCIEQGEQGMLGGVFGLPLLPCDIIFKGWLSKCFNLSSIVANSAAKPRCGVAATTFASSPLVDSF